MGYMRHHGILVTASHLGRVQTAHAKAVELGCAVTPVIESPVNGYCTFAVVPDGSKEGWSESDTGDQRRDAFKAWLHRQRYSDGSTPFNWVEVQYGDDDLETVVIDHNDTVATGDDYDGPSELE